MTKKERKTDPYDKVRRLLRGYGVDSPHLARAIGCCEETARIRLKEPARLTLHELRRICLDCGVPADELRDAISFGR